MNIIKKFNQITTFSLKKILKTIKLNESSISLGLGVIVVLIVGNLIFNYLKADRGSIPAELLNNSSTEANLKTHKVQKGETLWQIAFKYYGDGFKWVDIATENKLANASIIEVNQELIIPEIDGEYQKVTVNEVEKAVVENGQKIESDSYTVIKGDSLWNIAVRKYGDGYKWVEIAKLNNLSHPNLIHSGNTLTLPK